jgi:hypothetical protein
MDLLGEELKSKIRDNGFYNAKAEEVIVHTCEEVLVCSAFCGKEEFLGGLIEVPPKPYLIRKDKEAANIRPKFVKR